MEKLKTVLAKAGVWAINNTTIQAVQNGFLLLLPLILIWAVACILLFLPFEPYQDFLRQGSGEFLAIPLRLLARMVPDTLALLFVFTASWSFVRTWRLSSFNALLLPLLSLSSFIIMQQTNASAQISDYSYNWSAPYLFTALISAVLTSHSYRRISEALKNAAPDMPFIVSPYLRHAVCAMLPSGVIIASFLLLQRLILLLTDDMILQEAVTYLINSLFAALKDYPLWDNVCFMLIHHLFYFCGIGGFFMIAHMNEAQVSAGGSLPTLAFFLLTLPGGVGATLALVLAILYASKDGVYRAKAKLALIPSLFNIGSVAICSIPVMLNPVFLLPFLLVPLANMGVTDLACDLGLVGKPNGHIWAVPFLLSGFLTTGSFAGTLLQIFLVALDFFLYLPFAKLQEKVQNDHLVQHIRALEAKYKTMEESLMPLRISDLDEEERLIANLLMHDLKSDLAAKRLFMLYQPQFRTDGAFVGAEALLRWTHERAGFIYPPFIIALAKLAGILPDLERFIIRETCRSISAMNDRLEGHYKISINITGSSLGYDTLEGNIERAMADFSVKPESLWIEITEQDAIASTQATIDKLRRLKERGHKLLIDDFGMGHTSVAYLKTGLFDVLKLDGSLTRQLVETKSNQHIIASLVGLAKTMGLMVVAEFVDNIPQRDKLVDLGVDILQGYLYGPATTIDDVLLLAEKNNLAHGK